MTDEKPVSLAKPPARIVVQVHGWYPIVILVIVFVVASGLNVLFTLYVDNQRKEAEARSRVERAEASRRSTCQLVVAFDELYKETAPTTPAGENVAKLWADYRRVLNC